MRVVFAAIVFHRMSFVTACLRSVSDRKAGANAGTLPTAIGVLDQRSPLVTRQPLRNPDEPHHLGDVSHNSVFTSLISVTLLTAGAEDERVPSKAFSSLLPAVNCLYSRSVTRNPE